MTTTVTPRAERSMLDPADPGLYRRLAFLMNASPDRYRVLGDADMVAVFTIIAPSGRTNVQLVFEALACDDVAVVGDAEAATADFALVGPADAWSAMFADIVANGRAEGEWTINSLALRGDRIRCVGEDPMGLDKFSRFNQTLQEFLDGAGRMDSTETVPH
jgi:hypothetical protein